MAIKIAENVLNMQVLMGKTYANVILVSLDIKIYFVINATI